MPVTYVQGRHYHNLANGAAAALIIGQTVKPRRQRERTRSGENKLTHLYETVHIIEIASIL